MFAARRALQKLQIVNVKLNRRPQGPTKAAHRQASNTSKIKPCKNGWPKIKIEFRTSTTYSLKSKFEPNKYCPNTKKRTREKLSFVWFRGIWSRGRAMKFSCRKIITDQWLNRRSTIGWVDVRADARANGWMGDRARGREDGRSGERRGRRTSTLQLCCNNVLYLQLICHYSQVALQLFAANFPTICSYVELLCN